MQPKKPRESEVERLARRTNTGLSIFGVLSLVFIVVVVVVIAIALIM